MKTFLNNFADNIIGINHIIPEKFEKYNDSNKHVFFINFCSNLRAKNYKIFLFNEKTTKMFAGRIVPANSTITAVMMGFVCMQLISLINSDDFSLIKNCYFDSSLNIYKFNKPDDVIHIKDQEYNPILNGPTIAVPKGWTVWDIFIIKRPMTFQEFIDYIKKEYNVNILGIVSNYKSIIQLFIPSKKEKLPKFIEDIYEQNNGLNKNQKNIWPKISG